MSRSDVACYPVLRQLCVCAQPCCQGRGHEGILQFCCQRRWLDFFCEMQKGHLLPMFAKNGRPKTHRKDALVSYDANEVTNKEVSMIRLANPCYSFGCLSKVVLSLSRSLFLCHSAFTLPHIQRYLQYRCEHHTCTRTASMILARKWDICQYTTMHQCPTQEVGRVQLADSGILA